MIPGGSIYRLAFWGLATGLVFISLYPRLSTPYVPSGGDKVAHFVMYFVLAIPAVLGWPHRRWALLVTLPVLGFALEVLQIPIPGRGFEWGDALANTLGAFAGASIVSALLSLRVRPQVE